MVPVAAPAPLVRVRLGPGLRTLETCHMQTLETCHMQTLETCHMQTLETCHMQTLETCHMQTLETCHMQTLGGRKNISASRMRAHPYDSWYLEFG